MESSVCFLKSSKSSWFPLHCPMRLGWIQIRSTLVFTPLEVLELTADFMKKPFRLLVKRDELSLHGIQQFCVAVGKDGSSRSNGAVSTVLSGVAVKLCEVYGGAMEIWHLVRHFRFSGHHPSSDFLHLGIILKIFCKTSQLTYWRSLKIRRSLGLGLRQQSEKSGLVSEEDAWSQFSHLCHPWWYAAEGLEPNDLFCMRWDVMFTLIGWNIVLWNNYEKLL